VFQENKKLPKESFIHTLWGHKCDDLNKFLFELVMLSDSGKLS